MYSFVIFYGYTHTKVNDLPINFYLCTFVVVTDKDLFGL